MAAEHSVFMCPECFRVSHHPEDLHNNYCGACHKFYLDDEVAEGWEKYMASMPMLLCPCCGERTLEARSEDELWCHSCHGYCFESEAIRMQPMEALLTNKAVNWAKIDKVEGNTFHIQFQHDPNAKPVPWRQKALWRWRGFWRYTVLRKEKPEGIILPVHSRHGSKKR